MIVNQKGLYATLCNIQENVYKAINADNDKIKSDCLESAREKITILKDLIRVEDGGK